jgi:uncharacterized membrane protein
MKQFLRTYRGLVIIFLGYALFCLATSLLTHLNIYAFMIWNLFLALIPLSLSYALLRTKRRWLAILLGLAWILLIPNAFYVLTDLIHLSQFTFYYHTTDTFTHPIYIQDLRIWIGFINIVAGVIISIYAGLLSLRQVHTRLERKYPRATLPLMLLIFALIGCGVYIGRFLRYNSWNIFSPLDLAQDLTGNFGLFMFGIIILMASTTAMLYVFYDYLRRRREL